jgi:hypothetical protein
MLLQPLTYAVALLTASVIALNAQAGQAKPAPQAAKPEPKVAAKVALPAAVEAAFKKAYPNATIKHVSKETEKGQVQYEVESMDGTQARDLVYRADGTLVLYEELIPESAVPAAVVSAVKAKYPKATFSRCEKLFKDGTMNYELGLKGAAAKEVVITPEGKWVSPAK